MADLLTGAGPHSDLHETVRLMNAAPSGLNRRDVFAWAMYDWANSAWSTLSITLLVSYIKDDVFQGHSGTLLWGWGIGLTMLLAAVCSPVFGAIADAHASKHRWLSVTALSGAGATCLLFFATPDRPWLVAGLFLAANFFFELSLGFYNGFLPEIAASKDINRVSAWGYALGYVGGGLALALVILLLTSGAAIGLPTENHYLKRLGLLITGLWWGVFSLPTILLLRDRRRPLHERQRLAAATCRAVSEVKHTLSNLRAFRVLAIFLLGFLIYNDGVQTMISQASVFAIEVLSMGAAELAMVVLMIQFIAFPGAMLVGWLADRIGQKPALFLCLSIWIGITISGFFVTERWQFWTMAAVAALVLGGTQSISRAIMGVMTPKRHSAEFFGFFNFSGKATSVFGPVFFSSILALTSNPHLAIASLLVFFAVGLAVVTPVSIAEGRRQAEAAE